MAIDIDKYKKLREKSEQAKQDVARATGALEQIMKKITEEFGCESIAEAEELLEKLTAEKEEAELAFGRELEKFEAKWGDLLK